MSTRIALYVIVACGLGCGSGHDPTTEPPSGGAVAFACDPIDQTGCAAGQKCTWIVDIDATATRAEIGHVGCVAAGPQPVGASCSDAVAETTGGADACVAGALCISGACKPICDPQQGGGPGACDESDACVTYTGIFESAGDPIAGVCEPGCDPLTQRLVDGNAEACGSPAPAQPTATCVASDGFRTFHCAPTTPDLYANTDRVPPLAANGTGFTNGCAPGFIPFFYEDASGAMNTVCTGLCAPLKVDATIAADPAHASDNKGDATALGKLTTDPAPVAGHATCDVGIKGSVDAEDCRFLWYPLAQGDPTKALTTPYNDTLGVCFAYSNYLTVTIPGSSTKVAQKSCADLPVTAAANDPFGSARDNGCYPLADSLGPSDVAPPAWLGQLHVGAQGDTATLTRHIFD